MSPTLRKFIVISFVLFEVVASIGCVGAYLSFATAGNSSPEAAHRLTVMFLFLLYLRLMNMQLGDRVP